MDIVNCPTAVVGVEGGINDDVDARLCGNGCRRGEVMPASVDVLLRARAALAEIGDDESPLTARMRYGGMFSLLSSPSSIVIVVLGRLGLGVVSGVCSCWQFEGDNNSPRRVRLPRIERCVERGVCIAVDEIGRAHV